MLLLAAIIVAFLSIQAILIARFARPRPEPRHRRPPRIAVILAARGADPHLPDCLSALLRQLEPGDRIFVVTDHPHDPARSAVEQARAEDPHGQLEYWVATPDSELGSLKCHSLAAAVDRLDPSFRAVALIDADAVPDPQWLTRLTAPLSGDADASFAHRWFEPPAGNLGGWIRYIWNAAAVVQMQEYRIAWGGSLALRRSVIAQTQLTKIWKSSLFEDTLVQPLLARQRMKLVGLSNLYLVSREATTCRAAARWMARQLLDVWLYHPQRKLVMAHALLTGLLPLACLSGLLGSLMLGRSYAAASYLALLIASELAHGGLLLAIDRIVRRRLTQAGVTPSSGGVFRALTCITLIPLVQMFHLFAAVRAMTGRRWRWRGIDYRLEPSGQIRRMSYRPMGSTPSDHHSVD